MAFLRQVALRKCRVLTLLSALFPVNKGWDVEASLEWEVGEGRLLLGCGQIQLPSCS